MAPQAYEGDTLRKAQLEVSRLFRTDDADAEVDPDFEGDDHGLEIDPAFSLEEVIQERRGLPAGHPGRSTRVR